MDPITTAIVAAVTAGAATGMKKVGVQLVTDAYAKLKEVLGKKFGSKSKVVKAVKELEANPRSAARREVLKEEVAAAKADHDQELLKIARSLLKSIEALPGGTQIIQTALGDQNIQVAGDRNSVNVNTHKAKR